MYVGFCSIFIIVYTSAEKIRMSHSDCRFKSDEAPVMSTVPRKIYPPAIWRSTREDVNVSWKVTGCINNKKAPVVEKVKSARKGTNWFPVVSVEKDGASFWEEIRREMAVGIDRIPRFDEGLTSTPN